MFSHNETLVDGLNIVRPSALSNNGSAVAEMGDRGRAKWAENWGCMLCPFQLGELGPHQTQCRLGRGLPPHQVANWSIQPFDHNTPTLQTHRTDRQDNGPRIAWGELLLVTVAQNVRERNPNLFRVDSHRKSDRCQDERQTRTEKLKLWIDA